MLKKEENIWLRTMEADPTVWIGPRVFPCARAEYLRLVIVNCLELSGFSGRSSFSGFAGRTPEGSSKMNWLLLPSGRDSRLSVDPCG